MPEKNKVIVKGKIAIIPLIIIITPLVVVSVYHQLTFGTLINNAIALLMLLIDGWGILAIYHLTYIEVTNEGVFIRDILRKKLYSYKDIISVNLQESILSTLSMSHDIRITVREKDNKAIVYKICCIENAEEVIEIIVDQMKLHYGERINVK